MTITTVEPGWVTDGGSAYVLTTWGVRGRTVRARLVNLRLTSTLVVATPQDGRPEEWRFRRPHLREISGDSWAARPQLVPLDSPEAINALAIEIVERVHRANDADLNKRQEMADNFDEAQAWLARSALRLAEAQRELDKLVRH